MVAFVTYDFYKTSFAGSAIPEEVFSRYALSASMEIRNNSLGRIQSLIPKWADDIQITACQVAEILHEKEEMNFNVKSETNDGDSITYNDTRNFSEEIKECIEKNLWMTGLLYQGGVRCDHKFRLDNLQ